MFHHLAQLLSQFGQFSYQPKQNQADGGTAKIKVNPTQLSDQMPLPAEYIYQFKNGFYVLL